MFTFIRKLREEVENDATDEITKTDKKDAKDVDLDDKKSDNIKDKEGIIRYIKGAHLVYKRKNVDGMYDELWMFKTTSLKTDEHIKQIIIAGTDINPKTGESEDGIQHYDLWINGDITLLKIFNLPE